MLDITLSPEALEKMKELLAEDEDYDEPFFRIREVKFGAACCSRTELRVSIDERDELEDEITATVEGLPFVLHPDIINSYGKRFDIVLAADGAVKVTSRDATESIAASLFRQN